MQELLSDATLLIAIIGFMAFIVSVITQVVKGVLGNVPTDLVVFVLSIALTVTAFVAYMQYVKAEMLWYMIVASVIVGFVVAFVAMFGWEKLSELWKRFGKDVELMLKINQQEMAYSLIGEEVPEYETDENGNIKYDGYTDDDGNFIPYLDEDGNKIPLPTGGMTTSYEKPEKFKASINNKLDEVLVKEFGIDNSTLYAQIVADKGALPLTVGSLVWKRSEVKYKDDDKTIVDSLSADYTVKGVADEGLTADLFLLQKNVKNAE